MITITTEPTTIQKSISTLFKYVCTSDKSTETLYTGLTPSNSGGYIRINISSHIITVGDVVEIYGGTKVPDGFYDVTSASTGMGGGVTLDAEWLSGYSGDTVNMKLVYPDLRIKCEVYTPAISGGTLRGTIFAFPDSSNNFNFVVSEILKDTLSGELTLSSGTTDDYSPTSNVLSFQLKFTEWFQNSVNTLASGDTTNGSVSYINYSALQFNESQSMTNFLLNTSSQLFLTAMPRMNEGTKTVIDLYMGEWYNLGYLLNASSSREIRFNKADNNLTFVSTWKSTVVTMTYKGGLIKINNDSTTRAALTNLYCYIQDASFNRLSEIVFFRLHRTERPSCYTRFCFLNRYGIYEFFNFKGFNEEVVNADRELYEKYKPYGFSVSDREISISKINAKREVEVNSGYLSTDEMLWLQDILISKEVYVQDGSELHPVVISSSEITTKSRGLYQIELTYIYSNKIVTL